MKPAAPRPHPRSGRRRLLTTALALAAGIAAWWFAYEQPERARREAETRRVLDEARVALQEGRAALVLETLRAIPETGTHAAEILALKGLAYASFQKPERARPLLERSIALAPPGEPMVLKVLAAIYFNDEEPAEGFATLRRAADIDPSDFRPWYATGHFLLRAQNRPQEATEAFREALKRRADDRESRIGLAEAWLALSETEQASPIIDGLLAEGGDELAVIRLDTRRVFQHGRFEEVERLASRGLELDANDVELLVLRANARLRSGRAAEALEDAEKAAARAPRDLPALTVLSRAENLLGFKDRSAATSARLTRIRASADAIAQRRAEVRKHPKDPEARLKLGQTAAEGGLFDLARKSYLGALNLDPTYRPAIQALRALDAAGSP